MYGDFDTLNVRLRLSETKNSFLADTTIMPQPERLLTGVTYILDIKWDGYLDENARRQKRTSCSDFDPLIFSHKVLCMHPSETECEATFSNFN